MDPWLLWSSRLRGCLTRRCIRKSAHGGRVLPVLLQYRSGAVILASRVPGLREAHGHNSDDKARRCWCGLTILAFHGAGSFCVMKSVVTRALRLLTTPAEQIRNSIYIILMGTPYSRDQYTDN